MGNPFSKYVKIDLYKWSSSDFPQEYALVYTSLEDASKISTLRLSVNTDMVLCRHTDNMCNDHPVRIYVKITALRDSNGDCKFGEVLVIERGNKEDRTVDDDYASFTYCCDDESGDFWVKCRSQNLDRVNMERTYWEFSHSYDVGLRRKLKYFVSIQCNKETGLSVVFSGPFMYKGVIFDDELGLQSKREVSGEPPKGLIANAESAFEGKGYTLLKRNQNGCTLPSEKAKKAIKTGAQALPVLNPGSQASGLINNLGSQTQGHFNGAVLHNVQIYGQYQLGRTVETNNSLS
ncbi:unnamed protein product [Sphenostylis stenocarpa]|uniref:Uncharacterized protein n=1 Tax=Sphenostylis stenocarpa TaxID=92480 RepID=A0AA86T649_9FABA|nr:unnamed protein product [Sphenostylis stenocarpa]